MSSLAGRQPVDNRYAGRSEEEWLNMSARERRRARGAAWLSRSSGWKDFSGTWKPLGILGRGTYGICGLFEYIGNDQTVPKHIVVKQSGGIKRRYFEDLMNESRLLKQLGESGSPHIVKMYKSFHREGGTGTSEEYDPSPFVTDGWPLPTQQYDSNREVSRIYLEYCDRRSMLEAIVIKKNRDR